MSCTILHSCELYDIVHMFYPTVHVNIMYQYTSQLILYTYIYPLNKVLGPVPPTLQHIGFEKLNNPAFTSGSTGTGSGGEGGKTGDDAKKEPVKPKSLFERYVSYSIFKHKHIIMSLY